MKRYLRKKKEKCIKQDACKFFAQNPKAFFKFVVKEDADVKEVLDLQSRFQIPSERIMLMPLADRQSDLNARCLWVVDNCVKYGFFYSDRIHIRIFGSKRGV